MVEKYNFFLTIFKTFAQWHTSKSKYNVHRVPSLVKKALGLLTCMYFMKRWHFPQRDRGFPVAAMGEKETSINSSMPVTSDRRSRDQKWSDSG